MDDDDKKFLLWGALFAAAFALMLLQLYIMEWFMR